jgi:hypothetical protein
MTKIKLSILIALGGVVIGVNLLAYLLIHF